MLALSIVALCGMVSTATAAGYDALRLEDFGFENFTQKLDHNNALDTRTFRQRAWVNDKYWDPKTGPIFLYICGESTCRPPTEKAYAFQVCQDLNCLFYVLEHRYYGESQPFNDWSVESLKYLNSTMALADLDYFIKSKNIELREKHGVGVRKWMSIGGSYPGALSAWFKNQYPESIVAAWSSSGVIQPIRNFIDFDLDIYEATLRSGKACPDAIMSITMHIENALTNKLTPEDKQFIYDTFNSEGVDNGDFMFYIADTFTLGVQYGARSELCEIFMSVAHMDMKLQLPVLKQYGDKKGTTLNQYDRTSLRNITVNGKDNMRQWSWQYCTEFAWFQIPHPQFPLRSKLINESYWVPYCQSIFGNSIGEPAVDFYTKRYGGMEITGKNIIYANAIEDPWQYAGMRHI